MSACEAIACASEGCQATIHLHHDVARRVRKSHETFYCPAGHSNYFPGATDEEKKLAAQKQMTERFRDLWHEALEQRDDWKMRSRTCPLGCGFRVLRKWKPESIESALAFHLIEEHGAWYIEEETSVVATEVSS